MAFNLNTHLTEWLAPAQAEAMGQEVTYTRGAASVTLTAIYADNQVTGFDDGSSAFDRHEFVVLGIKVSELILNSSATEPATGDTITIGSRVYGIKLPSGQEAFGFIDPEQEWYRVEAWSGKSG